MQPIANAGLVCHFPDQLHVALAVTRHTQMQLLLQRRELRCPAQRLMERAKLSKERNQLPCKNRGIDLAAKTTRTNPNLCGQPIVIVILADRCALVMQNIHRDALLL